MPPVIVGLGVASRVHGERYYATLWDEFRRVMESLNVETLRVVTSREELGLVERRVKGADAAVVAVLTGGTSRLVREVAALLGRGKPLILLAHGFHNSLASALGAKSRLESEGFRVVLVEAQRPSETVEEAAVAVRAVRAVAELRRMRVIQLYAEKPEDEALEAARLVGFRVEALSPEETRKLIESSDPREVLAALESRVDLGGVNQKLIEKPARLAAAALRVAREKGAAVTINCFPFIVREGYTPCIMMSHLLDEGVVAACEADYRALLLLALSKHLTGKPGWIGNPSHYDPRNHRLVLAHCTAATSLGSGSTLVPHFETGNPMAVVVRINPGTYTLAAISPDFRRLAYALVEVIESGMLTGGRCRTQVVARIEEKSPEPFTAKAISNHHVLIPGDVRRELRIVAKLLGMEPVEY